MQIAVAEMAEGMDAEWTEGCDERGAFREEGGDFRQRQRNIMRGDGPYLAVRFGQRLAQAPEIAALGGLRKLPCRIFAPDRSWSR